MSVCVCVCPSTALAINTIDGQGLKSASWVTAKEEQGNTVFAVDYMVKAV